MLLVHRVDARAIGRVRGPEIVASVIRWPDVPTLDSSSHLECQDNIIMGPYRTLILTTGPLIQVLLFAESPTSWPRYFKSERVMHQRSGGTDSCKAVASMVVYVRDERTATVDEDIWRYESIGYRL